MNGAMKTEARWKWAAASLVPAAGMTLGFFLAGCGTPGAPLPPSLKLPDPVTNLSAMRTGNQVTLTWTMPRRNTDKLLINGNIPARICRKEGTGPCEPLAGTVSFAQEAKAAFTEILPSPLATGAPRPLTYFVELLSPRGRSAGLSNAAAVLAGEAPAQVTGLSAQLRKDGVVLRWTQLSAEGQAAAPMAIRIHRTLIAASAKAETGSKSAARQGFLAPAPEPVEQTLLVDASGQPGGTVDKTIRFGRTYDFRAQRVARVTIDGQTVELAGLLSDPIRVKAIDVFPPAVPSGLAAVATAGDSNAAPSIDLSWVPVTEADLAGYAVYRREGGDGNGVWQRISPQQPVVGPGFHDGQVLPGHAYRYAVTAIDQGGHESARSPEAEETVPNQ